MKRTNLWAVALLFVSTVAVTEPVALAQAPTTPASGQGEAGAAQAPKTPERATPRPGVQVPPRPATPVAAPSAAPAAIPPPPGYVIGADDVLSIIYWRDKDMTTDVQVRPDGKISLALLNDVDAAGLTPDQLREKLMVASKEYFEDPSITVVVKTINSRKVFITGQVAKQGPYPLTSPLTVMQLISLSGGLGEYADSENIRVLRTENGRMVSYRFNLKEVQSGKKLQQNIELKPGDTVSVP